jgi:hypothetical protein
VVIRLGGWLLDAQDVPIGTVLDGDHGTVSVLSVVDASVFDEDGGASVLIGDVTYVYTSADHDNDTITLTTPLTTAQLDGVAVVLLEDSTGVLEPAMQVVCTVELESDEDGDDDPAYPVLRHGLKDRVKRGNRGGRGEWCEVECDEAGTSWTVVDVDGIALQMDLTGVDPGTVPEPVPTVPPVESPVPVPQTGPACVIVRFEPTGPKDHYRLYVSEAGPDGAPPAVAPGPDTLVDEDFLPGQWVHYDATGTPLPTDKDVFFAVWAYNAADPAPAPSTWVAARAGEITEGFLQTVLAPEIIAGKLTGETIEGVNLKGVYLDILNALHAEPGFLDIKATQAEFLSATFRDNVVMQGVINWLAGIFTMSNGVSDPQQPPTVSPTYPTPVVTHQGTDPYGDAWYGLCDNPAGTEWINARWFFGGILSRHSKADGSGISGVNLGAKFNPMGGVTRIGTRYYFLGQHTDTFEWQVQVRETSGFALVTTWTAKSGGQISRRPAIGNDGTNLRIAFCTPAGELRTQTFTPGGSSSGLTTLETGYAADLGGCGVEAGNWAGSRFWVQPQGHPMRVYSTGYARIAAEDMPLAGSAATRGVWFDGTRWHSLSTAGEVWQYSRHTGASRAWTWTKCDSDAASPGGTAESKASPPRTVTIPRGAWSLIQVPAPEDTGDPDDPDTARVYATNQRQPGSAVGGYLNAAELADGLMVDIPVSGVAAPIESTFGGAGRTQRAGVFRSSASYTSGANTYRRTEFDGSGAARAVNLIQSGVATTGAHVVNSNKDTAVTFKTPFPAGVVPNVVLSVRGNLGNPDVTMLNPASESNTGFTIWSRRSAVTGALTVIWQATAPTP